MGDIDFKSIGIAAKDVIFGIGTAAAGASGGPAAAEGVSKASSGVDKLLEMVVPSGKKPPRVEQFDRADFAARPAAMRQEQASPPPTVASMDKNSQPDPSSARPLIGDAKIALDYLTSIGWSADKVRQMLEGPKRTSVAALIAPEVSGIRVPQVDGTVLPISEGRAIPKTEGTRVATVDGVRASEDSGAGSTGT